MKVLLCVHALAHACVCMYVCACVYSGSGNNLLIDVYTTIRIPPLGLRVPDKSVKLTDFAI